jgi:glyoxylase-like metal-dependent hydrolase (beta-lactamase superfamily II)
MSKDLLIATIVSAPFSENTYIVSSPHSQEAVIIDPGLDLQMIMSQLIEQKLDPVAIINTHGHADHIAGNEPLKKRFPGIPLAIGLGDQDMLSSPELNLSALFGLPFVSPPADRLLREGELVQYGGIPLEVVDLPGHTPGHIILVYRGSPALVFGGDVLFREGIGRYDFPGSNGRALVDGIRKKLFALPSETIVYPGHGPDTTIGHEKEFNPFVGRHAPVWDG